MASFRHQEVSVHHESTQSLTLSRVVKDDTFQSPKDLQAYPLTQKLGRSVSGNRNFPSPRRGTSSHLLAAPSTVARNRAVPVGSALLQDGEQDILFLAFSSQNCALDAANVSRLATHSRKLRIQDPFFKSAATTDTSIVVPATVLNGLVHVLVLLDSHQTHFMLLPVCRNTTAAALVYCRMSSSSGSGFT